MFFYFFTSTSICWVPTMYRFPTMLKMILQISFLPSCLPSVLAFLPSFLISSLPSLLASFLTGSSLWISRRGKGMLMWLRYSLPKCKTIFIMYYLIASIRHNGLDTSYSQTPLTFPLPCYGFTNSGHSITFIELKGNEMKWKPSTFLKVRDRECIWQREAQNCVYPQIRWQS